VIVSCSSLLLMSSGLDLLGMPCILNTVDAGSSDLSTLCSGLLMTPGHARPLDADTLLQRTLTVADAHMAMEPRPGKAMTTSWMLRLWGDQNVTSMIIGPWHHNPGWPGSSMLGTLADIDDDWRPRQAHALGEHTQRYARHFRRRFVLGPWVWLFMTLTTVCDLGWRANLRPPDFIVARRRLRKQKTMPSLLAGDVRRSCIWVCGVRPTYVYCMTEISVEPHRSMLRVSNTARSAARRV
jgi:hypothetical protein